MNSWKTIDNIYLDLLNDNRKNMHQAVQLVGAFPRNVLPHDPTDETASLIWNSAFEGLESRPLTTSNGDIKVGLSFSEFKLIIFIDGKESATFSMRDQSVNDGLIWLKKALTKMGVDSEKINLNLPYEIPSQDDNEPLKVDDQALRVFGALYTNTQLVLSRVIEKLEDAFDIRCWPHHFDIATLIPCEKDDLGEATKSIGVGLSPGDEGIEEPYIYVNVWPQVDYAVLSKHDISAGHWNKESWSGAVLTYTELMELDQKDSFEQFLQTTIEILQGEVK